MERKIRLQEFEALRAFSIILLMVLHSGVLDFYVFGYYLGTSAEFVAAFLLGSFFFLAGYFEDMSLRKRRGNALSLVKSKFFRIYPPYWIALILFVFVMGFTLKKPDTLVYLLNLQFIFSPAFVKQLLTLWYISVVVSYYIIFGLLSFRVKSDLSFFIGSVIVVCLAYVLHISTNLLDFRFFQYYFIFLSGMYFSRFERIREALFNLNFLYKAGVALLGILAFGWIKSISLEATNGIYLLAVNFFILSWVLMWLGIFRTSIGKWRIWAPISTASFFAYLYHRPLWKIFLLFFNNLSSHESALIKIIPGSLIVLILSYFLQLGYDNLLIVMRLKKL